MRLWRRQCWNHQLPAHCWSVADDWEAKQLLIELHRPIDIGDSERNVVQGRGLDLYRLSRDLIRANQ